MLFQRPHLFFQFREDIVNAKEILPFLLQLLYRHVLASLELHDTCRLIKQFSSFLRLTTQDPVNLSLADDGISFLSDTGIVEQLIDILKSACTAIDQILTLSGTVQLPRHSHFLELYRKLMI